MSGNKQENEQIKKEKIRRRGFISMPNMLNANNKIKNEATPTIKCMCQLGMGYHLLISSFQQILTLLIKIFIQDS